MIGPAINPPADNGHILEKLLESLPKHCPRCGCKLADVVIKTHDFADIEALCRCCDETVGTTPQGNPDERHDSRRGEGRRW